jgi:glucose-6-phosphate-specific signal transduction histidine kinase
MLEINETGQKNAILSGVLVCYGELKASHKIVSSTKKHKRAFLPLFFASASVLQLSCFSLLNLYLASLWPTSPSLFLHFDSLSRASPSLALSSSLSYFSSLFLSLSLSVSFRPSPFFSFSILLASPFLLRTYGWTNTNINTNINTVQLSDFCLCKT